jgi:hypothetical protein
MTLERYLGGVVLVLLVLALGGNNLIRSPQGGLRRGNIQPGGHLAAMPGVFVWMAHRSEEHHPLLALREKLRRAFDT